jgi:signal transduction histidine kinase
MTQDTLLAAVCCVLDLLLFSDLGGGSASATGRSGVTEAAIVLYAGAGYVALRWRRRAPIVVFGVLWVHAMVAIALPAYRPTIGLLLALYTVAAYCDGRTGLVALLAVGVTSGFAAAEEVRSVTDEGLRREALFYSVTFYAIVDVLVVAIGRWAGASRRHAGELERRRRVAAEEAVSSERARIARELHDIVSHAVTVMVLQAAGAQRMLRTDPSRAEHALVHIEELGKQAMGELRRLLEVLRAGGSVGDADEADLKPQPGLAAMDDLVEGMRRAGLTVRVQRDGEPRRLDRSVDLTAYRVLQEALTNVTKHVGFDASATAALTWTDNLVVRVSDDSGMSARQPASDLSVGHGLLGLRERVALVGGRLEAGPLPGRGFQVTATLPVESSAAVAASQGADGSSSRR